MLNKYKQMKKEHRLILAIFFVLVFFGFYGLILTNQEMKERLFVKDSFEIWFWWVLVVMHICWCFCFLSDAIKENLPKQSSDDLLDD